MKREEIVKALRCCGSRPDRRDCEEKCPYFCGIDMSRCIPNMTSDAAAMLESDAAEIAALKAENERIRQNSVSLEVYQMACEERDAAVADITHFCHLCRHRGENQDRCSACSNLKQEHDYFEWRGPQKEK